MQLRSAMETIGLGLRSKPEVEVELKCPGVLTTGLCLVVAAGFLVACGGDVEVRDEVVTTPYELVLPDHFPDYVVPTHNPTTEEGVALGRRLYYDPMLSQHGPLAGSACATCHVQGSNFSSAARGVAVMPHINHNWSTHFLWDGKIAGSLEDIMEFEVTEFFQTDVALFRDDPIYQELTYDAFGTTEITEDDMALALAQWMRTLVSYQSKYDRYMQGEVELTALEARGMEIFTSPEGDCSGCHALPLTTDLSFHNNGVVDFVPTAQVDYGRYNVTKDWEDWRKFKTPTLRNVALTAPYMHDGRFATLEEVVEHYNSGVKGTSTLSEVMRTRDGEEVYGYELHLTDEDKRALVEFLKTFTDETILTDPRFSSPFL